MAIFLIIQDEEKKHHIRLENHPITVGRSSKSFVKIKSTTASGIHCHFYIKDHKVIVKDLESKNGTFINGYKITESYIYIGDKVKIGNAFAEIDPKALSSIEKAANTRVEQAVRANEVELNDPLSSSRSVKMLTAIHNLETANIKVERKDKGQDKLSMNRPKKRPIKMRKKKKFSLFRWIGSFFKSSEDED